MNRDPIFDDAYGTQTKRTSKTNADVVVGSQQSGSAPRRIVFCGPPLRDRADRSVACVRVERN